MESKFKVGDKVRILDGSNIKDYTGDWCMSDKVGLVTTIEYVENYNGKIGYYMKEVDCIYDERGLELFDQDKFMEELKETLELHKKYLNGDTNGKKANLSGANLSGANLSDADLSGADLSDANLRYADISDANLSGADLSGADLSDANLRYANLSGANLSDANLSDADLSDAYLSDADLRYANLRYANLRYADLSGADLSDADLRHADISDANGLLSAIDYLESHFEKTDEGYIAYKTFGGSYNPPGKWVIHSGSIITENVNFNRNNDCGSGINVAPLEWVKENYRGEIWKVLIKWEWLAGVCVPYNTDCKIRCEKVQLLEVVK